MANSPRNNSNNNPDHSTTRPPTAFVIVGVTPGQPEVVAVRAAEFARRFDAELVCASVDPSSYAVEEGLDGSLRTMPFDPDAADPRNAEFDPALRARLARVLDGRGVAWSTRALVGDPAHALGDIAEDLDAAMIVVGSREPGVRSSLHEFFAGSVAAHLAHLQHRPVVVVPLAPVAPGSSLPWGP